MWTHLHRLRSAAAVLTLFAACSQRHAPPKDWHKAIDGNELSAACEPLIGAAGGIEMRGEESWPVAEDVPVKDMPPVIRKVRPVGVSISPVDVNIELGSYVHASGEHDHRGVVCSRGTFRGAFLQQNGETYLTKLGEYLWYCNGVM